MVDGVGRGSSSTVVDEMGIRKKKSKKKKRQQNKSQKKKRKKKKERKEKRGLDEEIEASLLHPKSP